MSCRDAIDITLTDRHGKVAYDIAISGGKNSVARAMARVFAKHASVSEMKKAAISSLKRAIRSHK
jgi:hypothetical protein